MNNEIRMSYEKEMNRVLEMMKVVDPYSDDYKELLNTLNILNEQVYKEKQLEVESSANKSGHWKDCGRMGVDMVTAIAPMVLYGVWMKRGLEFEKTGAFTSATFKGLIGKFKPTK